MFLFKKKKNEEEEDDGSISGRKSSSDGVPIRARTLLRQDNKSKERTTKAVGEKGKKDGVYCIFCHRAFVWNACRLCQILEAAGFSSYKDSKCGSIGKRNGCDYQKIRSS